MTTDELEIQEINKRCTLFQEELRELHNIITEKVNELTKYQEEINKIQVDYFKENIPSIHPSKPSRPKTPPL
jgi:uncharacterized membrane protein (DUF106 family)